MPALRFLIFKCQIQEKIGNFGIQKLKRRITERTVHELKNNAGIFGILTSLIFLSSLVAHTEEPNNIFKDINLRFAKLDIGGGLRLRGQSQENFNIKKYGQGNDDFAEERFRMEINFKFVENMHVFAQIQDAHVFGSNFTVKDFYPPYSPYENPLDLRQAFFEYQNIGTTPLGIKAGRQSFLYGDNRVLGPGEWCNAGRYFWDGIKLLYSTSNSKTDLFVTRQVISNPYKFDIDNPDLNVYGLYSALKMFNPNTDVFLIHKENDKDRLHCSTLGTRINGNSSMLFYSGTLAYQFGYRSANDIRAYGYNARLGYLVPKLCGSEFGAEYSYASGDDDPYDGKYGTFDGVLGAIDLYYGRMGLFSWMNLKDYQINLDSKPTRKLSMTLQYHRFELAESKDAWYYGNGKSQKLDTTGASGSFLGQEILLTARYVLNKYFNVYAGYCYFFPGAFMKTSPNFTKEASLAFFQSEYTF
jgi:hypothetical protein